MHAPVERHFYFWLGNQHFYFWSETSATVIFGVCVNCKGVDSQACLQM